MFLLYRASTRTGLVSRTTLRWSSTTTTVQNQIPTVQVIFRIPPPATTNEDTKFVVEHLLPIHSSVQAGQSVGTVRQTNNTTTEGKLHTVYAPSPGIVRKHLPSQYETQQTTTTQPPVGMEVQPGDTLVELEASEDIITELQQRLKGTFTDEYLYELLHRQHKDLGRIQQIAYYLRDSSTSSTSSQQNIACLRALEHLLNLQLESTDLETGQTYTDMGVLLYRMGDLDMALQQLKMAVQSRQRERGPHASETAASMVHVGAVLCQQKNYAESIPYFQQAMEIQRKHVPEENSPILAASINNLGAVYYNMGDFTQAIHHYRKALRMQQESLGANHPDTAGTHHNLSVALKHTGDFTQALHECQTALRIRTEVLDNDSSPDVAASHYTLGQLLSEQGDDFDEALLHYRHALSIQERIYGPLSPITAATHNNIGSALFQTKDFLQASKEYHKSLQILEKTLPENHPELASANNNVALAYYHMGKYEDALDRHTQAKHILEATFGTDHPNVALTLRCIGDVYRSQNERDKSIRQYKKSHSILETAYGPDHADVASSHNNIAIALSEMKLHREALEAYEKARTAFSKALGPSHPHTGSCHFNMALVHRELGESEESRKHLETAHDIWSTSLGADHPQSLLAAQYLEGM